MRSARFKDVKYNIVETMVRSGRRWPSRSLSRVALAVAVAVASALLAHTLWPKFWRQHSSEVHSAIEKSSVASPCTTLRGSTIHCTPNGEVHGCSPYGENCTSTKCCKEAGMQCFRKDTSWAECKQTCIPGPDPTSGDKEPWSCDALGPRTEGKPVNCSKMGENCRESQCCADPGTQCYEKNAAWATCRVQCHPGIDVTDEDALPWSCKPLGHRAKAAAPWVAKECAPAYSACFKEQCCSDPGHQCFEKDKYYGECMAECPTSWSCKTRGSKTPKPALTVAETKGKVADWAASFCSNSSQNCMVAQCCSEGGTTCYKKNLTWATCKGSCMPGPDLYDTDSSPWSCEALGMRTPGASADPWKQGKLVSKWVHSHCASGQENCAKSRCCQDIGRKCYAKNNTWATCLSSCSSGHRNADEGEWSCEELGPRTQRTWGKPSLFCISVIQPSGYESGLVRAHMEAGVGIFACDQYSLFSTKKFVVGVGPVGAVSTVPFEPSEVVRSIDGTAGNAKIFINMWRVVQAQGTWQSTDWTVKVDPDAVLLPERLRMHLQPHTGKNAFMVNCDKPYMPTGPMMFGAIEAISHLALQTYLAGVHNCRGSLDWHYWGEDRFMTECFDHLGVKRVNDFSIYSDGVCRGVNCRDPRAAAFHPKKDISSWFACLNETKRPYQQTTTQAPKWFRDYMKTYAKK